MNQSLGGNGKKASNEEPLSYLVKLRMDFIRQAAPVPYPARKRCSRVVPEMGLTMVMRTIKCNVEMERQVQILQML